MRPVRTGQEGDVRPVCTAGRTGEGQRPAVRRGQAASTPRPSAARPPRAASSPASRATRHAPRVTTCRATQHATCHSMPRVTTRNTSHEAPTNSRLHAVPRTRDVTDERTRGQAEAGRGERGARDAPRHRIAGAPRSCAARRQAPPARRGHPAPRAPRLQAPRVRLVRGEGHGVSD